MDKLEEIKRMVLAWRKYLEDSTNAHKNLGAFWAGYDEGVKDVTDGIMEIIEKED